MHNEGGSSFRRPFRRKGFGKGKGKSGKGYGKRRFRLDADNSNTDLLDAPSGNYWIGDQHDPSYEEKG